MLRPARIVFVIIFTAALGLFALPNGLSNLLQTSARAAATFTVNSTGDAPDANTADGLCDDGGGRCTLRAAVQQANALAGDDTINFSVAGTITLTSALPDLTTNVTINGPGARALAVSGNNAVRVFLVTDTATVTVNGLTIKGGSAAGSAGLFNSGTLTLNECAVTDNHATAGGGGGMGNCGTLTVNNSAVYGNTATAQGGGIISGSCGGGSAFLNNTTVSSNSAPIGGGVVNLNGFKMKNVTVTANSATNFGGGVYNPGIGILDFANTVIAGNSAVNSSPDCNGARLNSEDYNLVQDTAGCDIIGTTTHNIVGVAADLGPLQYNGGQTQTHAPLPAGPVIDKANSALTTDQRGRQRPFDYASIAPAAGGNNSDIGAVESDPASEAVTDKATNEDAPLSFNFFAGDQVITSVSASSGDQTLVPDANISVTGAGSERTVLITPAADRSGTTNITISFNGSVEGPVTRTFQLTVAPVNDAPTFTKGADQTAPEDAGAQAVMNWATAVSPGPDEAGQSASFQVTGDTNPGLFSSAPSVSPSGTLAYTPAANANGSATITLVLKDNGGASNGGQDTSAPQTFVVNVTPVNDAPAADSQSVAAQEDTPKGITLSGSDADGDALTFQIVSGPSHGTLSGSGAARTYTPAPNVSGVDSFTFKAVDPSGAESQPATVFITVESVNDAPVNTVPGAQVTAKGVALVFSTSNSNAVSTSDIDAGSNSLHVTLSASNGTLTLGSTNGLTFLAGDGTDDATIGFLASLANTNAALDGLTFKPNAGFTGGAAVQITTDDEGFSGTGGAKADTDSVSVTVEQSLVELSQSSYAVAETAGGLTVTVRRTGDTTQAASVDYATDDGSAPSVVVPCSSVTGLALDRCDYTKAVGTVSFAAGETEKTFALLVNDDSYTEGAETFNVRLSNAGGAATLGPRASASVQITDDAQESAANPIDDSGKFVRQHYHDFLNREPDAPGLAFWTNEIESCGANRQCRDVRRINVSAAFFLSIEFQNTGYLVERVYKVAYGDATSPNVAGTVPVIRLEEFLKDTPLISNGVVVGVGAWQQQLETNKTAYALAFVQRQRFADAFPSTLTPAQFVDRLDANAGRVLSDSERTSLVNELSANNTNAGRAPVLRKVAEDTDLDSREKNRAFVLMEYYGYLRRNPDNAPEPTLNFAGWKFWLDKLNQFNGNFVAAEMVKAFISSDEYRHRFGQ